MPKELRLGIAGLGTVGAGVIKILQNQAGMLTTRTGMTLSVSAVSARSRSKDRGVDLSSYDWEDDPVSLAKRDDVDVFVELMGGEDGPAKAATEAALSSGKDVVTANKALLAVHGQTLAELAEEQDASLRYEAAVAGGIPIIKAMGEGLAANRFERVMGVMNGTCNYILTRMENAGLSYDEAFAEADGLGYLEADPNLDVGGIDAAHKLTLLSTLAYGTKVNFDSVDLQGIQQISKSDIEYAAEMGYRIKLLGLTQMTQDGLSQSMRPSLVPALSPLGQLEGGTNMIVVEGDEVGQIVLRGAGAGEGPTASAVMGDVIDIARGFKMPVFGQPAKDLKTAPSANSDQITRFYMRLNLRDTTGVLARVATVLAEQDISIDRMRQKEHETDFAPVVIVTHPTTSTAMQAALSQITASGDLVDDPIALSIVDL